jgi:hypothetical protein
LVSQLSRFPAGRASRRPKPVVLYGPWFVDLLPEMTQRGVPGAIERLRACLKAAD